MEIEAVEKVNSGGVFSQIEGLEHEQIVHCYDKATGLKAIIGVHNTVLGPALGGTRMWAYENEQQALNDVVRLSRGMTFKASISGLNLGGGKAVIIGDARTLKNEALMRKFGSFVERLNGTYITAEDVGMTEKDMAYIAAETKHVVGLSESKGGNGDPSPVTAYGTYMGMKAAAKKVYGTDDLSGRKIALQGVGHVGEYLLQSLLKENAEVYVSEYYEDRLKEVTSKYNVTAVGMDELYDLDVDIYSPAALGATVNDDTINRLKCKIIAGCANNQLADENVHGPMVMKKGIAYVPDFLINAGGLINVCMEHEGKPKDMAMQMTENIYDATLSILNKSESEGIHTQLAATQIAQERIDKARK